MRIGIIGSMQYTEHMLKVRDQLKTLGHDAYVTELHKAFIDINTVALDFSVDKNGVKNYIGGNIVNCTDYVT